MWRLLNNQDGPTAASLHAAVAAAIDAASPAEAEQKATGLCANTVDDNKEKRGESVSLSNSNLLNDTAKMAVLRSPLFCTVNDESPTLGGEARTLTALGEERAASSEIRSYEAALRDLLTSVLPAVCA